MAGQVHCGPQPGLGRPVAGRLHMATAGLILRPVTPMREEAPTTSGRAPAERLLPPRRSSSRSMAYLQPSGQLESLDPSQHENSGSALQHRSAALVPAAPAGGTMAVAPSRAAASSLAVQEQGGASLLQLMAAWDQLAARLPPQAGAGRAAEVILSALKLALAYSPAPAPLQTSAAATASNSSSSSHTDELQQQQTTLARPVARALSLASRLADLAAAGLPIDAESIAAGILAEVLTGGAYSQPLPAWGSRPGSTTARICAGRSGLTLQVVEERVGPIVAQLAHDILRARQLPARVELLDDTAASALRELCLSFYDVRATAVEVVSRLDVLSSSDGLPSYEQQVCALEALQMYAPMGHALGLTAVAAQLEDRCFQILFPESYLRTAAWLREQAAANAEVLQRCQAALEAAVRAQPRFAELAAGLTVTGRTKSLFSTLKKLLRLGNTAAGGRARTQLYDLMGLRAVVHPRDDLPPEEAEALAAEACYLVRDAAFQLWPPVAGRCKDYIAAPKSNSYQSLHSTVRVPSVTVSLDPEGGSGEAEVSSHATLELQIRTQAMHDRAERGEAAHAAYKGGLDAAQALQLKSVTEVVLRRTAAAAAASARAALGSSDAAAEGLFRHLDQNNDGRISLEELQFALQELGVQEAQAQSRAASELLQLAAADGGEGGDGTIGFEAFMAFQRRVGLLQALSSVDHQQAHLVEQQQQREQHLSETAGMAASLCSNYPSREGIAGTPPGISDGASSSGRLAAGACRAHGSGNSLCWQPAGGQQLGGSWMRPCGRDAAVSARAYLETSSASTSSSDSSMDEDGGSRSHAGWAPNGSAVALQNRRHGSNGSSSEGAYEHPHSGSSNGSAPSTPHAAGTTPETLLAGKKLLQKPERMPVPAEHPAGHALTTAEPDAAAAEAASGDSRLGWGGSRVVQGIMRLMGQQGTPPAAATWQLVATANNPHRVFNAAGGVVPPDTCGRRQVLRLPDLGPCVIGAVFDRDCDYVLDVPTVSGRHAVLEVVRRPDARGGHSRLVLTDLGSTNGTRINRAPIQPGKEVTLHPGDLVCLAEGDITFEVQVLPPELPSPAVAASNGMSARAAAVAPSRAGPSAADVPADANGSHSGFSSNHVGGIGSLAEVEEAQQAAATLPAVVAALRLAGVLEAAAAAQGHFPPGGAVYADLQDRARQLMTAGSHDQAHALLLAGVMQQPWQGGLWSQLANLERQRARLGGRGASYGVARSFYAAAAACFAALTPAAAGGALRAEAERAEGLTRTLGGWAQLELAMGLRGPAHTLFRKGVAAAQRHPVPGAGGSAAARLLFTWAHKEWKAGDPAQAQRLCAEALENEPDNPFALCLLGNIEARAGQTHLARHLFERALEARPGFVSALQSLARLEASEGHLHLARPLFQQALRQEPTNGHVLQAWAVAEARRGDREKARALLRRCTAADPKCRAAWHAWAKLEEQEGHVELARKLYNAALGVKTDSVPTLSALGRLERRQGRLQEAATLLKAALAAEPHHVPAMAELALTLEAQGNLVEAQRLSKAVRRLNASRRASLHEVATQKLPTGIQATPSQPQHA